MAGKEKSIPSVADASYNGCMKTLSVKLPEALANWLLGEAKLTHRSRSEIVREALEAKRTGSGAKKRVTMADAMADLRGTISGPRDLSTNPKYFDDFGK